MKLRPKKKDQIIVKLVGFNKQIDGIVMPSNRFGAERNAAKQFRYEVYEVVDLNHNEIVDVSVGDRVVTNRWAGREVTNDLYALSKNKIRCKVKV